MYRSEIKNVSKDKAYFTHTANRVKKLNLSGHAMYRGGIRL